jgi:hypothetical protein
MVNTSPQLVPFILRDLAPLDTGRLPFILRNLRRPLVQPREPTPPPEQPDTPDDMDVDEEEQITTASDTSALVLILSQRRPNISGVVAIFEGMYPELDEVDYMAKYEHFRVRSPAK